jgi:heterodisulfide reductase subunit B
MTSFDKTFEQIKQLAEIFHSNHPYYPSPTYQETGARKDFIDKFFMTLGWAFYDQLVSFVTQMLETKRQIATAKTEGDKDFLENKCGSLDRQIDNFVYKLYDLTDVEIKIVEGG